MSDQTPDTNPPADRTAETRARLAAIGTRPWSTEHNDYGDEWWFGGSSGDGENVLFFGDDDCGVLQGTCRAEADLIANAPKDLGHLLARVEELERQLAAVDALHKPQRRYTTPDNYEASYDDPEWIVEAFDIPLEEVESFVVCEHCGGIEMRDAVDYREALWPCATAKARGVTGGPDEH